jgi:hypothetical protein
MLVNLYKFEIISKVFQEMSVRFMSDQYHYPSLLFLLCVHQLRYRPQRLVQKYAHRGGTGQFDTWLNWIITHPVRIINFWTIGSYNQKGAGRKTVNFKYVQSQSVKYILVNNVWLCLNQLHKCFENCRFLQILTTILEMNKKWQELPKQLP